MKVGELKLICELMNAGGLIDEFIINSDGHVTGIDGAKTIISDVLFFNLTLPQAVPLSNVRGIMEILSKYPNDTEIEIKDNKLHIQSGYRYADIVMKVVGDQTFKIPSLTNDDYEIIANNIDHNILNELSKLNSSIIQNEDYYIYVDGNILMFRIGEITGNNTGDKVSDCEKCTTNDVMKIIGNVGGCFKGIKTTANIKLAMRKLMLVECPTEQYIAKYYIAPRAE